MNLQLALLLTAGLVMGDAAVDPSWRAAEFIDCRRSSGSLPRPCRGLVEVPGLALTSVHDRLFWNGVRAYIRRYCTQPVDWLPNRILLVVPSGPSISLRSLGCTRTRMPTLVDSAERAVALVREGAFSDYWVFEKTEAIRGGKEAAVEMQVFNYILGKNGKPDFQGLDVFEVFQRGRRLVLRLWWSVAS